MLASPISINSKVSAPTPRPNPVASVSGRDRRGPSSCRKTRITMPACRQISAVRAVAIHTAISGMRQQAMDPRPEERLDDQDEGERRPGQRDPGQAVGGLVDEAHLNAP